MSPTDIPDYVRLSDLVILCGQPDDHQIRAAIHAGIVAIVNLAPIQERENALPDEAGLARRLGVDYYHVPVNWTAPDAADLKRFVAIVDTLRDKAIMIHCARNLRVTAFYALYAMMRLRWTWVEADALIETIWGKHGGLARYPAWRTFVDEQRAAIGRER